MTELYLRAQSEEELITKLSFLRGQNSQGEGFWRVDHDAEIIIQGTLYNDDEVFNENGEVVTPRTPMVGFYAILLCKDWVANLVPSDIKLPKPNNPRGVICNIQPHEAVDE